MKTNTLVLALSLALAAAAPRLGFAQNLLPTEDLIDATAMPASAGDEGDNAYADGVRAINAGRWPDAISIFSRIAATGNGHADGALYWKAYAENKQGQTATALDTCSELRRSHPGSNWIDDCGALEIEIHSRNGQPVPLKSEPSDDLKLLALASLMQHDERKALAEIDQVLNSSDSSEKLKQGVIYIMGEHHSDITYPQIARLSLVDGDVRVARNLADKHRKDTAWEEATTNLPLETGYSVVTGEGRAEIELEDASTVYLAPNSVLTVNDLSSTEGIPHTEVALLSGTVTLHVHPYVAGETFTLHTPTDNLVTRYPQTAYFRISSYTDGMAFTPMGGGSLGIAGASSEDLTPGKTFYFKDGRRTLDAGPIHPPDFSSWDLWVEDRTAERSAATLEVLKASGLSASVPGLADLAGKGSFFACEPYGTCWEPGVAPRSASSGAVAGARAEPAVSLEQSAVAPSAAAPSSSGSTAAAGRNIQFIGPPANAGAPQAQYTALAEMFPCVPDAVRMQLATLAGSAANPTAYFNSPLWSWATCHAGSWLYRGHRYVWVVGRRHHHPPFHWIKAGQTIAYVPLHPHDVKDRPPVNRMGPVFAVDQKDGHLIEPLRLETVHTMQLLKEPPREFRESAPIPLVRASAPHMEAHAFRDFAAVNKEAGHLAGVPITFDPKSQTFMTSHQVTQGSRIVSVASPISNRMGDLQSHSGTFGGGGSYAASSRSGGFGGSHGGSSGGGAAHGGGMSSGGGGSHGGGGATASSGGGGSSSGSSAGGGHK
jgi:FecR-like protein